MTRQQLIDQIFAKGTYLCVGLDTDPDKIPDHLKGQPDAVFEFNKAIIDATKDYCVAYKINTAFYEAQGLKGWEVMDRTVRYIPATHFTIADAKRGDIGNTSTQYAKAFFEALPFDAITVAPYMGADSVRPFLEYEDKWAIMLGLTSNPGARDFELLDCSRRQDVLVDGVHTQPRAEGKLFEFVLQKGVEWGSSGNLMFVVGATQAAAFAQIRASTPDHFYLVPGVGAQGGSLKDISEAALTADCGLLVNASRAIIYASEGEDFAQEAAAIAQQYAFEMKGYLDGIRRI
ncbi:orotidine-5'-phosphate decarboxylase [Flaviaesturariibacter aridisoli]|uniref:Orotidine-5'-phosphate decarboxylase n=1 Tax=Flaviaesturariibacter aridisoli TaxID=2545761 RepID=A0A4R4E4B9_9BACT|nr:orotidine-5'-phosphate decarboxylase [Flaviaesturariibacter aridisoli]TCZ74434.1 orotidine-5'-phosphate decarboxylase [Flaviaesturariibacter aridisoli]